MKILIACECSGRVRDAFRKLGHDAWSCDLKESETPSKYHIQDDVRNYLHKCPTDGKGWDMMIAHPPCTYLCRNRDARNKKDNPFINALNVYEGKQFFELLLNAPIAKICIENAVPALAIGLPKYTQIIQPYQHGHDHSKKTCLWLKGLPNLQPTKIVKVTYVTTKNGHRYTRGWYETPRNSTDRSRTFTGIATAMADQWGGKI